MRGGGRGEGGGGRGWIDLKHNVQVDELNAMHVLVEVTIGKDGSCWVLNPGPPLGI